MLKKSLGGWKGVLSSGLKHNSDHQASAVNAERRVVIPINSFVSYLSRVHSFFFFLNVTTVSVYKWEKLQLV